jgi:precorrin-8X/cobalt-precorrin-8 methylmutase
MPLFDRYIAVDWSANSRPKGGKDSIWIAEHGPEGAAASLNPRTRHAAMSHLAERFESALAADERTFVGFDFPFGYPHGAARRLAGRADWSSLWAAIGGAIVDGEDNRSNRFAVAAKFNSRLGDDGPRFWGCPVSAASDGLSTHKLARFEAIPEFRAVEKVARGAKSTWQLFYNGSVGSQCLLGIARLEQLRARFRADIAIWPFETDFERRLTAPVVLAEIYPSLDGHDPAVLPKDRAQVEAQVARYAALDAAGRFILALSLPEQFEPQRPVLVAEEGWIVGAGHAELSA